MVGGLMAEPSWSEESRTLELECPQWRHSTTTDSNPADYNCNLQHLLEFRSALGKKVLLFYIIHNIMGGLLKQS
jgi:hypothetical protein